LHERRFAGNPDRLRSPARLEWLEPERVIDLCLEAFAPKSVLDVGTGTGLFAERFATRGLKVAGIDAEPSMIEAARHYVPGVSFRHASAEVIPYPDHAFDLVFLGMVLHETDDRLQALREARRVARLGAAALEWPYQEGTSGPALAQRLSPPEITELSRSAGFVDVEMLPLSYLVLYRMTVG
jgi:ubiquinone/menaquinone biosynthesis C-methylase UbiE